MFTKQTVSTHITIQNSGLSISEYENTYFFSVVDASTQLFNRMALEGKTDGLQHNPLVLTGQNTGMWLDKYSWAQGVRVWTTEVDAQEYIDQITALIDSVQIPNYQFNIQIIDIDPDVLIAIN